MPCGNEDILNNKNNFLPKNIDKFSKNFLEQKLRELESHQLFLMILFKRIKYNQIKKKIQYRQSSLFFEKLSKFFKNKLFSQMLSSFVLFVSILPNI